ncbi:tetraspanin family domain-containing protein [Phthorimaea operculella]|nr:tetraspanin family domain-containing protein [Phthorimaea operculella]
MTLPPPAPPAHPAAHRAMRYYRIWIYACNGALLLGALAFCAAAGRALADYRRALVPGLGAAQPGFLYGYAALPAQAGLLQLLGCLAALRLSERMLNAYWLALLALLVGDVAIGVYWAFRFERVCRELKPQLKIRLARDYDTDIDFAEAWDRLQREQRCCGVTGPADFAAFNRTTLPPSCCRMPAHTPVTASSLLIPTTSTMSLVPITPVHCVQHTTACADRLLVWLKRTADALFVLGYCVIAFLKLCFLGILRYEIKEMIQKIRILRTEIGADELLDGSPMHGGPLSQTVIVNAVNANGGVRAHGGSPERGGEREALLGRSMESCSRRGTHDEPLGPKTVNGNNNCEMRELARGDYRPLAMDSAATRI